MEATPVRHGEKRKKKPEIGVETVETIVHTDAAHVLAKLASAPPVPAEEPAATAVGDKIEETVEDSLSSLKDHGDFLHVDMPSEGEIEKPAVFAGLDTLLEATNDREDTNTSSVYPELHSSGMLGSATDHQEEADSVSLQMSEVQHDKLTEETPEAMESHLSSTVRYPILQTMLLRMSETDSHVSVQKSSLHYPALLTSEKAEEPRSQRLRTRTLPDFSAVEDSIFFRLLLEYEDTAFALGRFLPHLTVLREQALQYSTSCWQHVKRSNTVSGRCKDGKSLETVVEWIECQFVPQTAALLKDTLEKLRVATHLRSIDLKCSAHLARGKVQLFIDDFLASVPAFGDIDPQAPVVCLDVKNQATALLQVVMYLRHMIEVLFYFERNHQSRCTGRKLEPGGEEGQGSGGFRADLRHWTCQLSGILLRNATFEDHIFLLDLLLCTPGIGEWAAPLLQFPPAPVKGCWNTSFCQHFVKAFDLLLQPVFRRLPPPPDDASISNEWTEVEGAENHSSTSDEVALPRIPSGMWLLCEDDFHALLQQFPFATFCDACYSNPDGERMVESVIDLLCLALRDFTLFSQFAKILARASVALCHTLAQRLGQPQLHSTEFSALAPGGVGGRILQLAGVGSAQKLLDNAVLNVCASLVSLDMSTTLQFVCVLPWRFLSPHTQWRALRVLFCVESRHTKRLHKPQSPCTLSSFRLRDEFDSEEAAQWEALLGVEGGPRKRFDQSLEEMKETAVFLLQAIASLAAASPPDLARAAVVELFRAGYGDQARSSGRCKCLFKPAAAMLSEVCATHPQPCFSTLIGLIRSSLAAIGRGLATYLLESLPLQLWLPAPASMETVRFWLLHSLGSSEIEVGMTLLDGLNWGLASSGNLFLGVEMHFRVALLLLECWEFHYSKLSAEAGVFSFTLRSQFSEFETWCWKRVLGLVPRLSGVPSVEVELSAVPVLTNHYKLATEYSEKASRQTPSPMVCYLVLQMTLLAREPSDWENSGVYGENAPVITLLRVLLSASLEVGGHSRFALMAFLRCLHDLLPLAASNALDATSLVSPSLVQLLSDFLAGPGTWRGLLRLAFGSESTTSKEQGPEHALSSVVVGSVLLRRPSLAAVTAIWLGCLRRLSGWPTDKQILGLADILLTACAVAEPQHWPPSSGLQFFENERTKANRRGSNRWLASENSVFGNIRSNIHKFPSLAFCVLMVESLSEGEERLRMGGQRRSGRDPPIQRLEQLRAGPVQWASAAIALPIECPLAPLYWQVFFHLYFDIISGLRPASLLSRSQKYSNLRSTWYSRLHELSKHYSSPKNDRSDDGTGKTESQLCSLFEAMSLWLSLPYGSEGLDSIDAVLGLGKIYEIHRLVAVLQQCPLSSPSFLWLDLVKPLWPHTPELPAQLARKLAVPVVPHGLPSPAPSVVVSMPLVLPYPIEGDALNSAITEDLGLLAREARRHTNRLQEAATLDIEYLDLLPVLCNNHPETRKVEKKCSTSCKGPVLFVMNVFEVVLDPAITQKAEQNRALAEDLLESATVELGLVASMLQIRKTVETLLEKIHCEPQNGQSIGSVLFYRLLELWDSKAAQDFPPTSHFLRQMLQQLADFCISPVPDEAERLLMVVIAAPTRVAILAPLFKPELCAHRLPQMFSTVLDVCRSTSSVQLLAPLLKRLTNATSAWIECSPPFSSRIDFLKTLFSAVVAFVRLSGSSSEPPFWLELLPALRVLVSSDFLLLFEELLGTVLQCSANQELPVDVWQDVVLGLPLHSLERLAVLQFLEELCDYFWRLRRSSRRPLYGIWEKYIPCFCNLGRALSECPSLFPEVSDGVSMTVAEVAFSSVFDAFLRVFEPWLAPFDDRVFSSIAVADPDQQPYVNMITDLLSHVSCNLQNGFSSSLLRRSRGNFGASVTSLVPSGLMNWLSKRVLPSAPIFLQDSVFSLLREGPWASWSPPQSAVAEFVMLCQRALTSDHSASLWSFMSSIAGSVCWSRILAAIPDGSLGGYVGLLFQWFLIILRSHPLPVPVSLVNIAFEGGEITWTRIPVQPLEATFLEFVQFCAVHSFPSTSTVGPSISDPQKSSSPDCTQTEESLGERARWSAISILACRACGLTRGGSLLLPVGDTSLFFRLSALARFLLALYSNHTIASVLPAVCSVQLFLDGFGEYASSLPSVPPAGEGPLPLLGSLMLFYNLPSPGPEASEVNPLLLQFLGSRPHLAPDAMRAACCTIPKCFLLAQTIESFLQLYFRAFFAWDLVTSSLSVLQVNEDEFVDACLKCGCCLALHSLSFERARTKGPGWKAVEQWPYQLVVPSEGASEVEMKDVSREATALLVWTVAVVAMAARRMSPTNPLTGEELSSLAVHILKFGEDRRSEGIFGMIGLGERSVFSPRFRIASKALGTFILSQVLETPSGDLAIAGSSSTLPFSKAAERQQVALRGIARLKEYLSALGVHKLENTITLASEYIADRSHLIEHTPKLVLLLASRLFPSSKNIFAFLER